MFDVSVALEPCMIGGVLSCGSVRSTRGIVATIIIPRGDNCFILHLLQSLSSATFAAGISTAPKMEIVFDHLVVSHGNVTLIRDVGLMRLFLTLCNSNSLRFNDYVFS